MCSIRSFSRYGSAAVLLLLALPVAAETLSSQLHSLVDSYHHNPGLTVARATQATAGRSPRLFTPHVSVAGKVQVYIHHRAGALPSRAALAHLGASDVLVSKALGVIQAWVPIGKLDAVAALNGVTGVDLPDYARVKGSAGPRTASTTCDPLPDGLGINHEGVEAENVRPLHELGITGKGIKIGIISDAADCLASSQAKGYLPGDIFVTPIRTLPGNESIAMMEQVHAIAPDAMLGVCGPETSVEFLACLDIFASWGADVISDDLIFYPVGYNHSEFLTTDGNNGIVVFARTHANITLTTSAGNDARDYYEANYLADTTPHSPDIGAISLSPAYAIGVPTSDLQAANRSYVSAMNFGNALGRASDAAVAVTIYPGVNIFANLTWNDPAKGPYNDLDLFLLDATGNVACQPTGEQWCSSTMDQMTYGSRDLPEFPQGLPPFEYLSYTNDSGNPQTLYLIALCYDCNAHGTQPLHVKLYGLGNDGAEFNYLTHGGVTGHASLEVEITTAAAEYDDGGQSTMEIYSDTGPFAYGDWTQPPKTRQKPDITGTDGVTISGAGGFGEIQPDGGVLFYGTSAASPNVGAVVALLRSFMPNAKPNAAGWKHLIMDTASTDALSDYSLNASGAGLIDARAAAKAIDPPMDARITLPTGDPAMVKTGQTVSFEGQCGYAGRLPLTYEWRFGAQSDTPASHVQNPTVTFTKAGRYTVTFTCSDVLNIHSATLAVEVTETDFGSGVLGGLGLGVLSALLLLALRRKQ